MLFISQLHRSSSVDIWNHIINRCSDGNKVGNQIVLACEVNNTYQVEARTLEM